MKKVICISILFSLLIGCSGEEDIGSYQNKKIYEFSWCSYNENYKPQDLNNELISYIGFLNNLESRNGLKKETKYLNPYEKFDGYDFIWLDIYENELQKNAFSEFSINSEVFNNWLISKKEIIDCDENKQRFYEINVNSDYSFSDGDQTYIGFCKIKDGFDLNYLQERIKNSSLFSEKLYNRNLLIPLSKNMDFDFVILVETDFFSKDLNIIKENKFINHCEEYKNFASNSLLFNTYLID